MATTRTNPRSSNLITEGEFLTLPAEQYSTVTALWLKVVKLIQNCQIFIFSSHISLIETRIKINFWKMCQFLPLISLNSNLTSGLVLNLTLQSSIFLRSIKLSGAVIQCLSHISNISNSNLARNVEALLSRKNREVEGPVDWKGDSKKCVTLSHFKVVYYFFGLLLAWWDRAVYFQINEVFGPYKCFCNMQKIFSDIDTP